MKGSGVIVVILALIVLVVAGFCVSGVFLGNSDLLNPITSQSQAQSTATFAGVALEGAQLKEQATATVMQYTQAYEQFVAQSTLVPMQQTADAMYARSTQMEAVHQSTMAAIERENEMAQQGARATQTQIAIRQEEEELQRQNKRTWDQVILVGILVVSAAIITGLALLVFALVSDARRKQKELEIHEEEVKMDKQSKKMNDIDFSRNRSQQLRLQELKDTVDIREVERPAQAGNTPAFNSRLLTSVNHENKNLPRADM